MIDFVNTVTARNSTPVDWLEDFAALREWVALSDLSGVALAGSVEAGQAEQELLLCRELRESLHAVLSSVADGCAVPRAAAVVVEENWREAAAWARLDLSVQPFALRFDAGPAVSVLRHTLAAAAVDLLGNLPGERLRRCPGEHCGWLFLDTSKAGRRRWCDMATCGTAGKNRRRREPA